MITFESNRQNRGEKRGEETAKADRLLGNIREALARRQHKRQSSKVGLLSANKRLGASGNRNQGKSLGVSKLHKRGKKTIQQPCLGGQGGRVPGLQTPRSGDRIPPATSHFQWCYKNPLKTNGAYMYTLSSKRKRIWKIRIGIWTGGVSRVWAFRRYPYT